MSRHTQMDYSAIEVHMVRARLQRSAFIGTLIAEGIFALWRGSRYRVLQLRRLTSRTFRPPAFYSTALTSPS